MAAQPGMNNENCFNGSPSKSFDVNEQYYEVEGYGKESSPKLVYSNICSGEEPSVGMEFDSLEKSFDYYSRYAHRIGFSVRKQYIKKTQENIVKKRSFCCSKQGARVADKRREHASFRRPITRVGCRAHMTCLLQKNGKFKVTSFIGEHNHEFIPSPAKHMLRSKRKLSLADEAAAKDADLSGISIKAGVDLLSRQAGGREHLGFTDVDYKNHVYSLSCLRDKDQFLEMRHHTKEGTEINPSSEAQCKIDGDVTTSTFPT